MVFQVEYGFVGGKPCLRDKLNYYCRQYYVQLISLFIIYLLLFSFRKIVILCSKNILISFSGYGGTTPHYGGTTPLLTLKYNGK